MQAIYEQSKKYYAKLKPMIEDSGIPPEEIWQELCDFATQRGFRIEDMQANDSRYGINPGYFIPPDLIVIKGIKSEVIESIYFVGNTAIPIKKEVTPLPDAELVTVLAHEIGHALRKHRLANCPSLEAEAWQEAEILIQNIIINKNGGVKC